MLRTFLAKLFGRGTSAARVSAEALERELDRGVSTAEITRLVPVILPLECLTPEWPGPIERIGRLPFALGWAVIREPNIFLYVNHELAAAWEESGISWRAQALANLARLSEGRQRARGEKLDSSGKPFVLALLHDDAFGPSRLLLPGLFDDVFGTDYRVAIPEQTCAVAYRSNLTPEEAADVDGIIEGCFRQGTAPMSPERFDPREFWDEAAKFQAIDRPSVKAS